MQEGRKIVAWKLVVTSSLLLLLAGAALAQSYRGPTRVEFDDRLIKGQTTKTG